MLSLKVGPSFHRRMSSIGLKMSRSDLQEALKDPRRCFNQDETAVELGVGGQWVLTPGLYILCLFVN